MNKQALDSMKMTPNRQDIRMSGNCVFDNTDLLEEILVRVPPQFISNSTLVSKSWLGLTRTSFLEHYARRWSHEVNQLQHRLRSQQLAALDQFHHWVQSQRSGMAEWFDPWIQSQVRSHDFNVLNLMQEVRSALEKKFIPETMALLNELQHQVEFEQLAAVNELQPQSRQLATMNELHQLVEVDRSQQLDPPQHLIAVLQQLRSQLLAAVDQLQLQLRSQLNAMDDRVHEQLLSQLMGVIMDLKL